MKNALSYYYGVDVEKIRNIYGNYFFKSLKNQYMLKRIDSSTSHKTNWTLSNNIIRMKNPLISEIIKNNVGSFVTNINNSDYVLLRMMNQDNYFIDEKEIIKFNIPIHNEVQALKEYDMSKWDNMWINKIDYFEMYINENKSIHQDYLYIYNYYIGLAELAIMIYRDAIQKWNDNDRLFLSHKRIKAKDTNIEFFDPINIVLDHRVRDIAEYYKNQIEDNKFNYQNFCLTITKMNLTKKEAQLFIARLLFPTCFFDKFEECLNSSDKLDTINSLLKRIEMREDIMFELIKYISDKYELNMYDQLKR